MPLQKQVGFKEQTFCLLPWQCLLVAKNNRKGKEHLLLPGLSLAEPSQSNLEFELAGDKPTQHRVVIPLPKSHSPLTCR